MSSRHSPSFVSSLVYHFSHTECIKKSLADSLYIIVQFLGQETFSFVFQEHRKDKKKKKKKNKDKDKEREDGDREKKEKHKVGRLCSTVLLCLVRSNALTSFHIYMYLGYYIQLLLSSTDFFLKCQLCII